MEGDALHLNLANNQTLSTWQLQRQLQNKESIQILFFRIASREQKPIAFGKKLLRVFHEDLLCDHFCLT